MFGSKKKAQKLSALRKSLQEMRLKEGFLLWMGNNRIDWWDTKWFDHYPTVEEIEETLKNRGRLFAKVEKIYGLYKKEEK